MNNWTLILRSLRYHARSHLGALLGAAVGSAVLIGALVVGDSVRGSLQEMALARLGNVNSALPANDRLVREQLAADLASALGSPVVPVLQLQGTATARGGEARANQVQVLGVNDHFWSLAQEKPGFAQVTPGSVILNEALARQLNVAVGDPVLLRVLKPTQLSRDAPLAPDEDTSSALRLEVQAIARDGELGNFSLAANQIPPFNAFVALRDLQRRAEAPERVNLLLMAGADPAPETLEAALQASWQLPDAQFDLRVLEGSGELELRTSRVFMDPPSAQAAVSAAPSARPVLTYFVNEVRIGDRATPYSMVTAIGDPIVPAEMGDDEILINEWLAEDLGARLGDTVELRYYIVGLMRKLEEQTGRFRVRAILPMSGPSADPALMPDFPGMTDAENCRDWDTGFPVQMDRIRDKDEKYWDEYRGTPKAFVTLAAGQRMWSNRFGDLTAIRYASGLDAGDLGRSIMGSLEPSSVGLSFLPARAQALNASHQSQDFGQLFLGFSFFLILAALLLMALLFQFGIEQRASEVGTLLALGFTPRHVRRLLVGEGVLVALAGALIGVVGGILYARAMLYGLSTIWRSAVGTSSLRYHVEPLTLAIGVVAATGIASLTIWFILRKQARQPARALLSAGGEESIDVQRSAASGKSRGGWIGAGAGIAALGLTAWAFLNKDGAAAGSFFGAGALLLISGLAFTAALLSLLGRRVGETPKLSDLGLRNATRRRRRSLATAGLLASGTFLILAIGTFRLDSEANHTDRGSGTGGFALFGQSTLPVVHDLNSTAGRDFFGLEAGALNAVHVVPMRVRQGEDASCLNLNRAQTPRLLGVQPGQLSGTFTFVRTMEEASDPWLLLNRASPEDVVPAIGDAASIQWALGKKVGDVVDYTDERGRPFRVQLVGAVANSILQGNLLISERAFVERFPSESGYRMFLIDAPSNEAGKVAAELSRGLQDVGLELTETRGRLAAFNAVQNTYLNTFQVLGGLGLLLGSFGLGVVVLRNVFERRGELALMQAVGFRKGALRWLVLSEHAGLLVIGLGIGLIAAFVAVLPGVWLAGGELPQISLALTLGAVLVNGLLWTWAATALALRGRLLEALRNH